MPDDKKPGVAFWATVALGTALVPVSIYVGAYAWMVDTLPVVLEDHVKPVAIEPYYSDSPRDNKFWEQVFGPIHWIDRKARPQTWSAH